MSSRAPLGMIPAGMDDLKLELDSWSNDWEPQLSRIQIAHILPGSLDD